MKKISVPGYVTIAVLLIFGGFYAFDPSFRDWLARAYDAFSTGEYQTIKDFLNNYRDWGYLILMGAFLFQMFLFVVPSVMVMTLSIIMYGPWIGSLVCLSGIFLASTVAYFLGQGLSTVTLDKIVGRKQREKMSDFLEDYGFWTVFIFRMSPFLSNDAVSFVAGLVSMTYWRFISATMLGIIPLTALIAYFGRSTDQMETGLIIGSLVGLVGLILYIYIDKKKMKPKRKAREEGNSENV